MTTVSAGPFNELRILGIAADESACGKYRISYPLEALKRGGATVEIVKGFGNLNPNQFDFVLAQRQYSQQVFDLLFAPGCEYHTTLYECDDNLHRVHPTSSAYNTFKPGGDVLKMVDRYLRNCDGLFCSTPELASQYRDKQSRFWTLPNLIDFGTRDWETPVERHPDSKGKLVVGWSGGITHQDDFEPIASAISRVVAKYDHVVFAMASAYVLVDFFAKLLKLPEEKVVRLDPVSFEDYPLLLAQFDIGIAPLVNTEFNRAKSDLKIKEYGGRGVPFVATRIAPYTRFHYETNGQAGYLASTSQEWEDALCHLIEDEQDRKAKSEYLWDTMRTNYSYDANAWRWATAFREARDFKFNTPEYDRKIIVDERPGRNSPCPCGATKPDGTPVHYKRCCSPAWGI